MSFIESQSDVSRLVNAHRELAIAVPLTHGFRFVPLDAASAAKFVALKRRRIRNGIQDLKIAAMIPENDATLLTRNLNEFSNVPGLKVQNRLE